MMRKSLPIVTVVVPVYNREAVVMRLLADFDAQTDRRFKVVLVDNNSTDGSAQVLRRWVSETDLDAVAISEKVPGASAARQCGLNAVDTEWTLFFDSDDRMAPTHIERFLNGGEHYPHADIIGWDVRYVYPDKASVTKPFAARDVQFHSLFHGTMATQRYAARTALFRRAGGWNPAIRIWDDIELGARILALNPSVVRLVGAPTVNVCLSSDSISHGETAENIDAIDVALDEISRTLGSRGELWTALKRAILAAGTEGTPGKELYRKVKSASSHPLLISFAYHYTRLGGRGAARLLRAWV